MKVLSSIKMFNEKKPEIAFFIKLIFFYCIFNFGFLFWIGLCIPGNNYSPFADKYLDFMSWLKGSLMYTAGFFAELLGYDIYYPTMKNLKVVNGHGVTIANSCSGYGIMSLWAAFIIAFPSKIRKKIKWLVFGLFGIWLINVIRIFALLIAVNQKTVVDINKFGEHHNVFNFFVYAFIIIMIYFYTKTKVRKVNNA